MEVKEKMRVRSQEAKAERFIHSGYSIALL